MSADLTGYKDYLRRIAFDMGAVLFGIANIENIDEKRSELPEIIGDYPRAISVAIRLSSNVLDTITDHPTKIYLHHYKQVNYRLDQIALRLNSILQFWGYSALPIPASQIVDWDALTGDASHRVIANLAGLGFIGRSRLLVNPEFGSQIRLVSVLTDCPIPFDKPINRNCGDCYKCMEVCPAGAISESPDEFALDLCKEKLKSFGRAGMGQYICGVCVKVCRGSKNSSTKK